MATAKGPPMSLRAIASAGDPGTLNISIGGRIEPKDVPRLCGYVCAQMQATSPHSVLCDLRRLIDPDAVVVEALARLQLAAIRRGCTVELRNASDELLELLELTGLDEIVPVSEG